MRKDSVQKEREMNKTSSAQSGRSIIEMLGVLAIIGVLTVGGIAGFSAAMSKHKINQITDQVQRMVTNIRALYAGKRTYAGLDNKTAYTMGIFDDGFCDTPECENPTNSYKGSILLGLQNGNHHFSITYNGLTRDACTRLAMKEWGDSASGFLTLIVNGTEQKAPSLAHYTSDGAHIFTAEKREIPVPLAKAVAACDHQTATGSVDGTASISWIYR